MGKMEKIANHDPLQAISWRGSLLYGLSLTIRIKLFFINHSTFRHTLTPNYPNVDMLCRKENIQVRYINFGEIEDLVKKKISGAIQKSPDGRVTILVNEKDIETRARFTIAHELGHYYLHMDDCDAGKLITSFRLLHAFNSSTYTYILQYFCVLSIQLEKITVFE